MENQKKKSFLQRYIKFRSSIYGQVIYVITLLSLFLFVAFGIIFRSVNEKYMQNVLKQCGNRIGFLVEGALYQSMLENNKKTLRNTMELINKMPGIDHINLYNETDKLVITSCQDSITEDSLYHCNTDCIQCHEDFSGMFSRFEKSYKIMNANLDCGIINPNDKNRHLLIKSPILNTPSCYQNACHVHQKTDRVLGSLIVQIPLHDLDEALQTSSTDFFLLATIMTIILLSFLIFFTTKKIRNPLKSIIKASEAVAEGDTSKRLEMNHNQLDDMRMVSLAFNNMLDNLESATHELKNWSHQLEYKVQKKTEELAEVQNELIHIERIASLGKLSSSVAHEINNPLSGVLTYTKLVQKQLNKPEFDEAKKKSVLTHLKMIESETKRCGDIVKGLLDFSRKDQKDFQPKELHTILKETCELMAHQMKIENISCVKDFGATKDLVKCSQNQIKQALVAILVNSIEAIRENGEILIRTSNPDEENVRVDIKDNGSGIPEEDIPHVFEPFFSKKQKASGIGLGLAIVHGIVQSHKGKIDVNSKLGEHTTISITLPLTENK